MDKFISDAKPWDLAKNPDQREPLKLVLHTAVETLRHLAVLLVPVLPESTQAIQGATRQTNQISRIPLPN
ncbi:MAG: hypothetical protein IPG76_24770 [Acidobacteria bacterium]|nr:hypothetical protein [Acidobacteriota bacterium]